MATSTIQKDNSVIIANGNVTAGVNWYRRGNVIEVSVNDVQISDTTARTLLGSLPVWLKPPVNTFASGFASGTVSYVMISTDGDVYGYRSVAGKLTATVLFGVV